MTPYPATLGVILAGGLARRMGGVDKALLKLQGETLAAHIARRLGTQCDGLILNANGNPSRFAETKLFVVPDSVPEYPGPLAGILAAMEWSRENKPSVQWIASIPGDTPFLPMDFVERLHMARNASQATAACAVSGSQHHFATGLWPVALHDDLRHALVRKGVRRVEEWAISQGLATASWPAEPIDPFFNINTPEDLDTATAMMEHVTIRSAPVSAFAKENKRDG